MTQQQDPKPKANGGQREQAWRDTLSPDQRLVADYLGEMTTPMGIAWVGVEVGNARSDLKRVEAVAAKALQDAPLATAKAIADALKAANPTPVITTKSAMSPAMVTFLTGAGIVIGGVAVAVVQQWM